MEYNKARVEYLLQQPKTHDVVQELVARNKGLIFAQLKKFFMMGDDDALSLGYEALFKAITTFASDKPASFPTYATVCIYNALGVHLRNSNTLIYRNTIHYEQNISGTQTRIVDMLEDEKRIDDGVLVEDGVSDIYSITNKYIDSLANPLHKLVIETWAESNFNKTQAALAEELDISQTYVCRIVNQYRKTLKEQLEAC